MKKIALLSFHNAANYGAALQAFALQEALNRKGYVCEYIDYRNTYRSNAYNMSYHVWSSLKARKLKSAFLYFLGTPFMCLRKYRFHKFYRRYLHCTVSIYHSSTEARVLNDKYDKFIVGSDQVWNYENNGRDFAFLLDFVTDDKKKISYSSSFGLSSVPRELHEEYKSNLLKIKHISVRERYAVDLVRELSGRCAELVLDPVFLLSREEWQQFLLNRPRSEYIFTYTNQPGQVEQFFNQTGYDIQHFKHYKLARATSLLDFLSGHTCVKYAMSPSEFISCINYAELVVSASFHCIALSIVLNKPFVAILTGDTGKDERILSILQLLGLQNRIYSPSMTLEEINLPINYKSVNEEISRLRKDSFQFLINSIEK